MTIADVKSDMRKRAYPTRERAKAKADPAPAIAALLDWVRMQHGVSCVSGYIAIRTEIDPLPALEALARDGMRLCLPVVAAPATPLKFRRWAPDAPLIPGTFGTAVPTEIAAAEVPDLLIVPLLAFDRHLCRLGYGGGFYDRTLAELRAAGGGRAIGLAFAAQEVPQVPTEPTDLALDAIATDRGLYLP